MILKKESKSMISLVRILMQVCNIQIWHRTKNQFLNSQLVPQNSSCSGRKNTKKLMLLQVQFLTINKTIFYRERDSKEGMLWDTMPKSTPSKSKWHQGLLTIVDTSRTHLLVLEEVLLIKFLTTTSLITAVCQNHLFITTKNSSKITISLKAGATHQRFSNNNTFKLQSKNISTPIETARTLAAYTITMLPQKLKLH